jgi:hypothetical protein
MPAKNELKVEGNQVLWFNGEKWLVRETLDFQKDKKKNEKAAKDKLQELNERKNA